MAKLTSRAVAGIHLAGWLVFGVFVGLAPLILDLLKTAMSPDSIQFEEVLGRGELFIVSAVVGAGVLGEVVTALVLGVLKSAGARRLVTLLISSGFAVLLTIANTGSYMVVSGGTVPAEVMEVSLIMFALTLFAGVPAIVIAAHG
jgi:hypothetical protein